MQTRQICTLAKFRTLFPTRALAAGLAGTLLSLSPAFATDVLVVDASGAGAHTTIQAAVDASIDGDMILVRAGTYAEEVTLTARALTLVADGPATIAGHLFVRDLAPAQVLLVSGFTIAPPDGYLLGTSFNGALDARACEGKLRLQDCDLKGAHAEGDSPFGHPVAAYGGGPGALLEDCADTGFVDCTLAGGVGGFAVVAPGGAGGPGLWARDATLLALVRCSLQGGEGGNADDPGSGGNGTRIEGNTELHIAYSATNGGDGGCYSGFMGSPNWPISGGDGLLRGSGTVTWDFAGIFAGGVAENSGFGCTAPSGDYTDGSPHSGPGTMQDIPGYPNSLQGPAVVRDGEEFSLVFSAQAGEAVRLFHSSETTFVFAPSLEQPRMIGGASVRRYPGTFLVPADGHVTLPLPALALPPAVDGYVHWFQGFASAPGGGHAYSSYRAIIFLNAGF